MSFKGLPCDSLSPLPIEIEPSNGGSRMRSEPSGSNRQHPQGPTSGYLIPGVGAFYM